MDEKDIFEFYVKKEMMKKEISVSKSKYNNFSHKIQITGDDEIEKLLSLLHESIHWYINNQSLCILSSDFALLFNYLKYFYLQKKEELFMQSSELNDITNMLERLQWIMSHTKELDYLLAKDNDLVNFCEFCINIFNIYIELTSANICMNEGLATYYSLNATKDCFIFNYSGIPNIFDMAVKKGISYKEILKKQDKLKEKLLSNESDMELYNYSYRYTKCLCENYGDDYLLRVLLPIIFSDFNIYEFNLLNYDFGKIKKMIHERYSYDIMFINLYQKEEIIKPILNQEEMDAVSSKRLYNIITNYLRPYKDINVNYYLDTYFFKHPRVVNAIEKVLNRKMKDDDYSFARMFSSFQPMDKSIHEFFEYDKIKNTNLSDVYDFLKNMRFNYQKMANKNDLYSEKSFISTYYGMRRIVDTAKIIKR